MSEISQKYAQELARQVDELEAENERLRAERDLWQSRCYAALWLVPDEKTCGELQEAAWRSKAMLGNEQSPKIVDWCADCGAEIAEGDVHGCPGRPGENQW